MENIPLHLLKSLIACAESENLIQAASKLGITQPALSKQMISLEQLFPYPLFTQQGRRKILTSYGREIYQALKGNLGRVQDSIAAINNRFSKPEEAIVKIAARREVIDRLAPKVRFPGAIIYLDSHSADIADDLIKKKIDVGISQVVPDNSHLIAKKITPLEFKIFVPKSIVYKRLELNKESLLRLLDLPYISYELDYQIPKHILRHYKIETSPKVHRANSNFECIAAMLESDLGWAVAPENIPLNKARYWILDIPHSILPPVELRLIYQKEFAAIPWFKDLLASLLQSLKA